MVNFSLAPDQVRELDHAATYEFGIPSLVLMENAGRGCVDRLEQLQIVGPVVVACGKGNNGGDGLVVARHLELRGYEVRVILAGTRLGPTPDAAANLGIVDHLALPCVEINQLEHLERLEGLLAGADWIVDALLGIGVRGAPRAPLSQLIERLNAQAARKFAVDVPSGLDALTGAAATPTFRADHTCTFVAPKTGFANPAAAAWLGTVHVADIGAPRVLVQRFAR